MRSARFSPTLRAAMLTTPQECAKNKPTSHCVDSPPAAYRRPVWHDEQSRRRGFAGMLVEAPSRRASFGCAELIAKKKQWGPEKKNVTLLKL